MNRIRSVLQLQSVVDPVLPSSPQAAASAHKAGPVAAAAADDVDGDDHAVVEWTPEELQVCLAIIYA